MKNIIKIGLLCLILSLAGCSKQTNCESNKADNNMKDWKTLIEEKLPLMGHRNWIVVTDMAYPLQTKDGITTLFATEDYQDVIAEIDSMIKEAPHVFAHIYQDKEQQALSEQLAPGWDSYKEGVSKALDLKDVTFVPHEELIYKLDEVSKLYEVVIIKTNLTIPYTSTFFELDCGYWDAEREAAIRK